MQLGFRVYALPGCPNCSSAVNYLQSRGVPVEVVEVDPLLITAIPQALQMTEFHAPLIMSYATEEIIIGCNFTEMARCVDAFYRLRASDQLRGESSEGLKPASGSAADQSVAETL